MPDKATAAFIKRNCANYDKDGKCLLDLTESGRLCPFMHDVPYRCKYGRESVLPADPDLSLKYEASIGQAATAGKACADCGEPFEPKSNRQERCSSCGAHHRRKKKRGYNREYQLRKYRNN
ncbi:cysteine-rich VLP protein [Indiicoccus explosivorum]|uniref:cysteine-rich VLP protein n=1 Tax=Indiicoccus explosivorum TaxID=1917864 RepID=UPI000B4352AA|nr:cysteine-rich VLP protein [Indiicoccus explosivorum]